MAEKRLTPCPGRRTASTARSSPKRGCSRTDRPPSRFLCSNGPRRFRRRGPFFDSGRLGRPCRKTAFSDKVVPKFADAPVGDPGRRATWSSSSRRRRRARARCSRATTPRCSGSRTTRPSEAVSDALLNRSLFSPRRIVELDISRLLGTESPGRLVTKARRGLGRAAQAAGGGLQARAGAAGGARPAARARTRWRPPRRRRRRSAARTRRRLLAEILKELPEEKSGGAGGPEGPRCASLLERGENDGTVALLTAVVAAGGRGPASRRSRTRGLVLETTVGDDAEPALRRLAATRAKEREVVARARGDRAAPDRARTRDAAHASPRSSRSSSSGRARAAGSGPPTSRRTSRTSPRRTSTAFFDAIGRRDAGDALARLERLLRRAGRARRATATSRRSRTSGPSSSSGCSPARSAGCC